MAKRATPIRKSARLRQEILSCRDRNGHITRQAVVDKARRERNSLLHRELFTLNNAAAAEKWRLEKAGELICRYVTLTVIHRNIRIKSVGYVRDPMLPARTPGVKSLAEYDRQSATQVVLAEIARCESAINRARAVTHVLDARFPGLVERLEQALEALLAARSSLSTGPMAA